MVRWYNTIWLVITIGIHFTNGQNSHTCQLSLTDQEVPAKITSHGREGAKLVKYELSLAGYDKSPLAVDATLAYHAHQWHKVFNRHGMVLLTLIFNYDVLSLSLLQFGVVNLNIELADKPKGCFGALDDATKVSRLLETLIGNFQHGNASVGVMAKEEFLCHQVLDVTDGGEDIRFADQCCQVTEDSVDLKCHILRPIPTVSILYYLIVALKIAFFFYGPLALQGWVSRDSMKNRTYIVPRSECITAKALDTQKLGKNIPKNPVCPDKDQNIIFVDNRALMDEKSVPVGLFRFLIDNFLKCKITYIEPFKSCCSESLVGSWSPNYLCFPLRDQELGLNRECKRCLSWRYIFVSVGSLLTLGFLSLPFIVRLIIFYIFEESEIENRRRSTEALGYELKLTNNTFQTVSPTDAILIFGYTCYLASFLTLAALKKFWRLKLAAVLFPALDDMMRVSYIAAIRTVIAYLVLPFAKFGIFGFIVIALVWPFALPVCLITLLCYCLPSVYLMGRFLIPDQPSFLRHLAADPEMQEYSSKFSGTLLKLNDISPSNPHPELEGIRPEPFNKIRKFSFLIGMVCIVNMCTLIAIYAEVIGFITEVTMLSVMGAIINASSAHKYIMLAFWILMYTAKCYNQVYECYSKLNQKLFELIKKKLNDRVLVVTLQTATKQKNTAFKYFTKDEIDDLCQKYPDGFEAYDEDKLREKKKQLLWNVRSLVLFVDSNDVARIPKKLFFDICEQELEGCPGPVYKSLARATKNLMYMVVFLLFVFLVILTFGSIYSVSSTNQLLLTLAGGFLPTVIRFVIQPNVNIDTNLNTYTSEGRIQQVLYEYTQEWPVAVLNGRDME